MNGDPIGARLFTRHRSSDHARLRRASRLPHRRDVIDVDVKPYSHFCSLCLVLGDLFGLIDGAHSAWRKIPSTKLKVQSSRRSPIVHGANGRVVNSATRLLTNQSDFTQHFETVAEEADLAAFVVVPANRHFAEPQPGAIREIKQLDVEPESIDSRRFNQRPAD